MIFFTGWWSPNEVSLVFAQRQNLLFHAGLILIADPRGQPILIVAWKKKWDEKEFISKKKEFISFLVTWLTLLLVFNAHTDLLVYDWNILFLT